MYFKNMPEEGFENKLSEDEIVNISHTLVNQSAALDFELPLSAVHQRWTHGDQLTYGRDAGKELNKTRNPLRQAVPKVQGTLYFQACASLSSQGIHIYILFNLNP